MPLLFVLAVLLLTPLVFVALMPLGLVQRYRAGTARRVLRGWVATVNIAVISFSVMLFLCGAGITSLWVPNAFSYSLAGLAGGCVLAVLGLALTRWERVSGRLHYTPNRLLVLAIMLIVTARLAYGVWRLWSGWRSGMDNGGWLVESGLPGSLAAGAVVLGYSLCYWIGISRQGRRMGLNSSEMA